MTAPATLPGSSHAAAPSGYCGRFAPSPTGPLHFGSMVAALASFLEARQQQGRWLLRMEDLDTARCSPQAADLILRQLEAHGLEWDGPVLYQSQRSTHYQTALDRLTQAGQAYPCACTRSELARITPQRHGSDGALIYPGCCRAGLVPGRSARAWRLRVERQQLTFEDAIQGPQTQPLDSAVGDFILRRADGLFAYQLAVVVDDAEQGITHVLRGADLLDSTPRQILLQQLLGYPTPHYAHVPVAVDQQQQKLSKQTRALAVSLQQPSITLHAVLEFLGQQPPAELQRASLAELWHWAQTHWRLTRVARSLREPCPISALASPQNHSALTGAPS